MLLSLSIVNVVILVLLVATLCAVTTSITPICLKSKAILQRIDNGEEPAIDAVAPGDAAGAVCQRTASARQNAEHFVNAKAEAYWSLREWLERRRLAGLTNEETQAQLAGIRYLHTDDLRAVQDFLGHADPRMTARMHTWWTWPKRIRRCSFRWAWERSGKNTPPARRVTTEGKSNWRGRAAQEGIRRGAENGGQAEVSGDTSGRGSQPELQIVDEARPRRRELHAAQRMAIRVRNGMPSVGAATDTSAVGEGISEFHGAAGREMLAGFWRWFCNVESTRVPIFFRPRSKYTAAISASWKCRSTTAPRVRDWGPPP